MTGSAPVNSVPLPGSFTVMGGGPYCSGGSGAVVGLNGSAVGVSYQLIIGAPPGTNVGLPDLPTVLP